MRHQHLFHLFLRQSDVHQWTLAHSRAPLFGLFPFHRVVQKLGPVRKRTALQGLNRVNTTAAGTQKYALRVARNPQTSQLLRTVQVLLLESFRRQPQMGRDAEMVGFGQVDEAPLVTAIDAAALALEALLRDL